MRTTYATKERAPASQLTARSNALRPASRPKAARLEMHHETGPLTERDSSALRNSGARQTLNTPGRTIDQNLRPALAPQFNFDLSQVRIHNDEQASRSAAALNADAYTSGTHIVFGKNQFNPTQPTGRALLAHELTHVAQQSTQNPAQHTLEGFRTLAPTTNTVHEAEADRAANRQNPITSPLTQATPGTLQRKIAMRDVGKGEHSGFAKVPDLVARLNAVSTGLTFTLAGSGSSLDLTYTAKPGGKLSNFDTQMQGFIDQGAVIPLRFTNKDGLLGNKRDGFHEGVTEDAWSSGYVDIDDLLASSDLGMQSVLVHFIRERTATKNYEKRIGSESLVTGDDTPDHIAHQAELDQAHSKGIDSELQVLKDFFSDPTIRLIDHDNDAQIFRIFRNGRGDTIRTRVKPGKGKNVGIDPVTVEVVTKDKKVHTPEEYLALIAAQAAAAPAAGPAAVGRPPNPPP